MLFSAGLSARLVSDAITHTRFLLHKIHHKTTSAIPMMGIPDSGFSERLIGVMGYFERRPGLYLGFCSESAELTVELLANKLRIVRRHFSDVTFDLSPGACSNVAYEA